VFIDETLTVFKGCYRCSSNYGIYRDNSIYKCQL